jgi:hypothetical protein
MAIPKAGNAQGGRKKGFLDIPSKPKLKSIRCLDERYNLKFEEV